MTKPNTYVVMRKSGKIMGFKGPALSAEPQTGGPYLSILATIAAEGGQSDRSYDPPDKLFLNGELVVPELLAVLASRYEHELRQARIAATDRVNSAHTPAWAVAAERQP